MIEIMELLKGGGFDLLIPLIVAISVQSVKMNAPGVSGRALMIIGGLSAFLLSFMKNYELDTLNLLIYNSVLYAGASIGFYTYGKNIPVLKLFFTSKPVTDDADGKTNG